MPSANMSAFATIIVLAACKQWPALASFEISALEQLLYSQFPTVSGLINAELLAKFSIQFV